MSSDAIVLLAKQPGFTSFSSLRNVKRALNTNKVGHTGTLDSFAQGLLVVCSGHYTKLCGQITAFDKTYEAVIHFGKETDTCEYTGNVIRQTSLPTEENLRKALDKWTGDILQKPPLFSAIHVDGKRASDLARDGKQFEIPERSVKVFSSKIIELKKDSQSGLVEYARIEFSVSKGTYIRSLARDIAESAGSSAYLTGLFRTKVGNFHISESAGYKFLKEFNIDNAVQVEKKFLSENDDTQDEKSELRQIDSEIQKEILLKIQNVSRDLALLCGFETISLKNKSYCDFFKNGKPLKSEMFDKSLWDFKNDSLIAVFVKSDVSDDETFVGLINKNAAGKVSYGFVIN